MGREIMTKYYYRMILNLAKDLDINKGLFGKSSVTFFLADALNIDRDRASKLAYLIWSNQDDKTYPKAKNNPVYKSLVSGEESTKGKLTITKGKFFLFGRIVPVFDY